MTDADKLAACKSVIYRLVKFMYAYCNVMQMDPKGMDEFQSLIIDPASVTVIDFDGDTSRLIAYNDKTSEFKKFMQSPKSMKALLGGGSGTRTKRHK